MERALAECETSTADVDYVAAQGNGTKRGDESEAVGLRSLFGDTGKPAASSVKAATGDLIGGSGALNAAVATLAVHHGRVPPTLNLEHVDPACSGVDWVPNEARELNVQRALALARGFEGQNVAVLIKAA
jgi:3-oxoacyl-[acyl-carrier-protein] synthase II